MHRSSAYIDPSTFIHQKCIDDLCSLAEGHRKELLAKLCNARLWHKHSHIMGICDTANNNWSQTSYTLLLSFMGGSHNRKPCERLSLLVPYNVIMRENSALHNIEALLMGGSGLLDICPTDSYTNHLRQEFSHLSAKYSITPMSASEWVTTRIYPHSHPLLRLAQVASLLHHKGLSMSELTSCSRLDDIKRLFATPPSEYWRNMILGNSTHNGAIGTMQSNILGINFIAPIVYTYGYATQNVDYQQRAITLLSTLPAEDNRYMRIWQSKNTIAKSAYDSQALLELSKEYCIHGRCEICPLNTLIHDIDKAKRLRRETRSKGQNHDN